MPSRGPRERYGAVAQAFHWLIAALIVTQFVLANLALDLPIGAHKLALFARHKSVGMTVLMLAILRLLWRLKQPPPGLPAGMAPWERFLARATHAGFYVLLFAMPVTGWLMSSAKNYSVSWFGLFTWPNLIGKNESAFEWLRSTHDA
jgi:cytochrome b561